MTREEQDRKADDRDEREREEREDERAEPAPPPEQGRTPPHGDPLGDQPKP
jgi:hypothetical protein